LFSGLMLLARCAPLTRWWVGGLCEGGTHLRMSPPSRYVCDW